MTEQHVYLSAVQIETVAGFSAGTISTLIFHPLDVVKTRLQIYRSTSTTHVTTYTILNGLLSNKAPIRSLYRGLTPNLLGSAGSWSFFLGIKSIVEDQILKLRTSKSRNDSFQSHNSMKHKRRDTLMPFDFFLASATSGMMVSLTTNPIWVLKTRMVSSDRGKSGAYENLWQGAKQIIQKEGVRGFYRGAGVSLLGNSHGAVQFGVYEPIKKLWKRSLSNYSNSSGKSRQEEKLTTLATLAISGTAKIIAGTVTYPLQVIKSRLQVSDLDHISGGGIVGVAGRLWREQGWRGFYKGLSINIIRVLPATWVTFLVYENVRYYLAILA
ncbi:Mitochondrial FAD carrier protein FLX1 [Erysiphe neolycopersici]|uniref:Mitochondrial FAD carrier protein FLX1 n=1 Tax=Erysiphe neolycopersici TaxID=212602 RepID=A0A420HR36_9PEZI|nr:Mitochondrial FAD carrier protein FLX1 [Erysiphe neolycopersici]